MVRNGFIILVVALFTLTACRKERTPNPVQLPTENFVFGDASFSNVNVYNIYGFEVRSIYSINTGSPTIDSLDIDNDGQYDILFSTYASFWDEIEYTQISALNNSVQFNVKLATDSIILNSNNQNPNIICDSVLYNPSSGYIDDPTYNTLIAIDSTYFPLRFHRWDTINTNAHKYVWKNEGLFAYRRTGYPYSNYSKYYSIIKDFGVSIPEDFMCFRKKVNGQYKFGWIELSIINYSWVECYRYAFQK